MSNTRTGAIASAALLLLAGCGGPAPFQNGAGSPGILVVQPGPACRVSDTKSCAGCSVSCRAGQQASCKPGTDSMPGGDTCVFQSSCSCF